MNNLDQARTTWTTLNNQNDASKWIQRTRRSLTTIIYSSVSEMDSSSADSAFNFLLISTYLSISSRSSLCLHLLLIRLLFLTNLRSFFFFPFFFCHSGPDRLSSLPSFSLVLLRLPFLAQAVREGLLLGLVRFRTISAEIKQLCNELPLIFLGRRSFFFCLSSALLPSFCHCREFFLTSPWQD